jgi:hypothetical protein
VRIAPGQVRGALQRRRVRLARRRIGLPPIFEGEGVFDGDRVVGALARLVAAAFARNIGVAAVERCVGLASRDAVIEVEDQPAGGEGDAGDRKATDACPPTLGTVYRSRQ